MTVNERDLEAAQQAKLHEAREKAERLYGRNLELHVLVGGLKELVRLLVQDAHRAHCKDQDPWTECPHPLCGEARRLLVGDEEKKA